MEHEPESIKQQMSETRAALGEKLDALEQKVTDTVKETTQTVSNTVQAITGTVDATVQSVTESVESVKESLDISARVQEHPWLALGCSVAAGYALGTLLTPPRLSQLARGMNLTSDSSTRPPAQPESSKPSVLAPIIDKVQELALGIPVGLATRMLVNLVEEATKPKPQPAPARPLPSNGRRPWAGSRI